MSRKSSVSDYIPTIGTDSMASANEIFIHLTVPQIVQLNGEYKAQVTRAKQDLHNLVGTKYRDLIRIAEDIDEMTQLTEEVDTKLADLSYRQTKFVNFSTKNPYAKFNSQFRQTQVKKSRDQSKPIILNYLINKKLVAFDLKILNGKITNVSVLIYFAKVYHSIEFIFSDILSTNSPLNTTFLQLKQNFIDFLQSKLSTYNPSTDSFLANSHSLDINDILQSRNKQAPTLESDDFDFLEDDDDPDNLGTSVDGDETDDLANLHLSYSNTYPQIVIFLISYIILNHTNPELNTLTKILDNFISLRLSYMNSLISELKSTGGNLANIKFFQLFKYVENTCEYVERYFEPKKLVPSDLFRLLKQASAPWKATDIIGFHHWFEFDDVKFNQDVYLINLPQSSLAAAHESLSSISSAMSSLLNHIFDSFNSSKDPLSILTNHLIVLHNFIVSLGKVEISCAANGKTSKFLALVTSTGLVEEVLQMVTSNISRTFSQHCETLSSEDTEDSIINVIKKEPLSESTDRSLGMFSVDLVDFIDTEINDYINYVRDSSLSSSFSTIDRFPNEIVTKKINDWFDLCISLTYFLETDELKTSNRKHGALAFVHLVNFMGRKFDELNDRLLTWGKFSQSVLLDNFRQLNSEINNQFWVQITALAENIEKLVNPEIALLNAYFLLQITIVLKGRIQMYESKDHKQNAVDSLDRSLQALYKNIIDKIPQDNSSYLSSLENALTATTDSLESDISYDIPTRPTLKLSSLLYQLSSKFLSPGSDQEAYQYTKCFIFTDVNGKDIFAKLKNEWLKTKLIDNLILAKLPLAETKLPVDKAKVIFAELVYISCFLNNLELVNSSLAKINEVSESPIAESTSQAITKGINDYYKSSKNLYLPLLIN